MSSLLPLSALTDDDHVIVSLSGGQSILFVSSLDQNGFLSTMDSLAESPLAFVKQLLAQRVHICRKYKVAVFRS